MLELARSGANLRGVVTFHGSLKTHDPAAPGTIKASEILVLHGSRDPLVPPADVAGFMDEMNAAKVPFRLVAYPDAVHAFTNPEAGNDPSKPTAYNAAAAHGCLRRDGNVFCPDLRLACRPVKPGGALLKLARQREVAKKSRDFVGLRARSVDFFCAGS